MQDIFLNACHHYLPSQSLTVADAVSQGLYAQEDALRDDYQSVSIETELWPFDMATNVAQQVLTDANITPTAVSFLSYSYIHRQGHKPLWQPAAYLQRHSGAKNALAISLNHGCNSMMLAAKLAIDHLSANAQGTALVVSADRFSESGFDRFKSDYGVIYGDAAVAAVFSCRQGPFKVLDFQHSSVPELEEMHRSAVPTAEGELTIAAMHDTKETKKAFLTQHGKARFIDLMHKALSNLSEQLQTQRLSASAQADYVILPNVGLSIQSSLYRLIFTPLAKTTLWDFGRTIGHAGASDQFLGLAHLWQSGRLRPGQKILLVGAGAGFSCSTLLLEVC